MPPKSINTGSAPCAAVQSNRWQVDAPDFAWQILILLLWWEGTLHKLDSEPGETICSDWGFSCLSLILSNQILGSACYTFSTLRGTNGTTLLNAEVHGDRNGPAGVISLEYVLNEVRGYRVMHSAGKQSTHDGYRID
jgi:hypothetical protein